MYYLTLLNCILTAALLFTACKIFEVVGISSTPTKDKVLAFLAGSIVVVAKEGPSAKSNFRIKFASA